MKKIFTILGAMLLTVSAFAQTFNGGTWYSLYDTESHEMYTIASYTADNVFAPTAGSLQFNWNYTKWLVGAFPSNATHIYTSADGGSNTTEVGTLTETTWDTEHSENITIGANINWLKWNRPTGNTHYVHIWNIAVPLARHILLSGGDYGKTSVTKTFVNEVKCGESASIRADFRSFLTNGDITISLTEGDAEVFRLGSEENTTGVLANSTSGNSYAVGANACASANGTANACANGQLAKIGNYSFMIYFCPKAVGETTGTITITDGTSTASIVVKGTGAKADVLEVPVELSFCQGGSVEFHGNTYSQAGTDVVNAVGAVRDTTYNVTIVEQQPTYGSDNRNIVYGTQEIWNGIDLSSYAVGTHYVQFNTTNVAGCDSTVTLTLTVHKMETLNVPVELSFCQGGSVEYRGITYTAAGTDVVNAEGTVRDTIYNVTIVELLPTSGSDSKTIVYGAQENWNGIDLSGYTVGKHTIPFNTTNIAGCDSTVTLTLTVTKQNAIEVPVALSFCEGDQVAYRDTIYTEAGTDEILVEGETVDTLYQVTVTVNQPYYNENDETKTVGEAVLFEQDGWLLRGETPVEGVYMTTKADTAELWFIHYGQTVLGCDSVERLNIRLELLDPVETEKELEMCEGEQVEYRGVQYNIAGEYPVLVEDAVRDTLINVIVTVHEKAYAEIERTVLAGEVLTLPEGEWTIGDQIVSGTFETQRGDTLGLEMYQYDETEFGCESVVKLIVTVTPNYEAVENVEAGEKAEKFFRNGVLYIRRGDRLFTTDGREAE